MMFWIGLAIGFVLGALAALVCVSPSLAALSDFKRRVPIDKLVKLEQAIDTHYWEKRR